jgi:RNA polymerase sigma-70 factor (ECF subfamily)
LQRFRDGDRAAFDEIVGKFRGPLEHFFYRLCWDRGRSEDLAQEVFLRILRGSRTYVAQGKLSTFLFRVATNLWIDNYRSSRPRPRMYSIDQPILSSAEESTGAESLAAKADQPVDVASDKEEKLRLRKALERLTEPHRLVFELAVYQELPYEQIAATLSIPVGTVKSRMHNTVRFLRRLLAGDEANGGQQGHASHGGLQVPCA